VYLRTFAIALDLFFRTIFSGHDDIVVIAIASASNVFTHPNACDFVVYQHRESANSPAVKIGLTVASGALGKM